MDEVGWEGILLLQSVGLPVDPEALGLAPSWPVSLPLPFLPLSSLHRDSLTDVHRAGKGDALDATFHLQARVKGR